jgi:hypothetical protein
MSLNAIGSGQKLEQISVITGSNPGSSAAFEAQLAAALLPNALPPAFLSKGRLQSSKFRLASAPSIRNSSPTTGATGSDLWLRNLGG